MGGHVVALAGYFRHEGIYELVAIDEGCLHGEAMAVLLKADLFMLWCCWLRLLVSLCGWVGHLGAAAIGSFCHDKG